MLKSCKAVQSAGALAYRTRGAALAAVLAITILGCATPNPGSINMQATSQSEDIYVLRSLREERIPKSTWCTLERAGFQQFVFEDRFSMWSVRVQQEDGRIADAKAGKAGDLQTCFGSTADPKVVNFYAEGHVAQVPLTGNGECHLVRADFPEKGLATYRCYLNLRGLSSA